MVDSGLRMAGFIGFHLFDNGAAFGIGFGQLLQVPIKMRFDLAFGFGEEAEVPFIAQ